MDIGASEAETFCSELLHKLVRRGLRGIKLVISDAHGGLKAKKLLGRADLVLSVRQRDHTIDVLRRLRTEIPEGTLS
jgi:hypothetical protein